MSANTTTGASRQPLTFFYLGRPASRYIDAASKRRARPVTSTSTAVLSAERPVAVVTGAGRGIGRLLALRLSDVYAWAQRQLNAGRGAEPDRAIEQIYRLTTGRYDELSGRHVSVHDDLDEILRNIHDVGTASSTCSECTVSPSDIVACKWRHPPSLAEPAEPLRLARH